MSLYRGAGGASDATDDSTVNAVAGYASAAASSASTASTSATNASNSATAAASSASGAASSASSVATNATNAANSAGLASTYAAAANNSKDNAATSAVTASTKAGEASTSASNAATSASNSATQATAAASSASAAATSASNAATSASNASSSASSALAIYGNTTAMNTAVASAATSASNASTSASNANDSRILAEAAVSGASSYASAAQSSANNAQASATSASTYASNASSSASNAATSASNALTSANNAAASAATASTIVGSGNGIFGTTPISTSGTVTLNGGTANGVPYLNSSKVLTTGSALTFNGTNFSVTGASTTSTLSLFQISAAGQYGLWVDGSNFNFGTYYNNDLIFKRSNSEAMRLTSTGLGIGTSSPGTKLSVQGVQGTEGAMGIVSQLISTTAYNASPIAGISLGTAYNAGGSFAGMGGIAVGKENATDGNYAGYLALYTRPNGGSTTERMRLDSAGNLSVGMTSGAGKINAGAGSEIRVYRSDNATYGSIRYVFGSGGLQLNDQNSDGITFVRAGSTESMRIDSSGNLLVGTTSVGSSSAKVIGMGNATAPTTSPAGMGQLYVEGGALKYRGSSGTVTILATA